MIKMKMQKYLEGSCSPLGHQRRYTTFYQTLKKVLKEISDENKYHFFKISKERVNIYKRIDFICNYPPIIIELFGNKYRLKNGHQNEEEFIKNKVYFKDGFSIILLWAPEYLDKVMLKNRILLFCKNVNDAGPLFYDGDREFQSNEKNFNYLFNYNDNENFDDKETLINKEYLNDEIPKHKNIIIKKEKTLSQPPQRDKLLAPVREHEIQELILKIKQSISEALVSLENKKSQQRARVRARQKSKS